MGCGDRPLAVAPVCDLAELASVLARVESLIAAAVEESPDAAAALERIADIAFVLQEREVEPSLCDALDAAMREIGEANARNLAGVQRAHEAVELLRTLARRLEAMITAQAQPPASQSAPYGDELECADELPPPAHLFDADVAEDGAFAQTVAALVESLPERSDAAPVESQDHVADCAAAPVALAHSDVEPEQAETSASAWQQAENPESGVAEEVEPPASVAASVGAAAAPAVDNPLSIDPDEDPGDLFEPAPDMRTMADAARPSSAISASTIQHTPPPPSLTPQSPPGGAVTPVSAAAARPAANDPLAPIRALSEEELIALFS